ncbi:GntR family transcriptional regulator [Glycomyces arizonensis]|uniref:GntR family transcriptional regulator n=1 Tax=Glycomyces arizonensis TaxID=256035 RepID=UPI00041E626E|nr:GntR family transcriptional regulator [Glycomyces arizonensis]
MERVAPTATKSEFAYLRLRDMIVSGVLAPGEVINQAVVASDIGVSTTPLREALRRLEGEGLVQLGAHRDARVTALTAEEARDLLEMRRSLCPLAASLATERRTDEDIEEMREAANGIDALPSDPGLAELEAYHRFYGAVYRASHNELLVEALDSLANKADRYQRLALAEGSAKKERGGKNAEYRKLLESIVSGDADAASASMLRHVESGLGAKALDKLEAEASGAKS